MIAKYAIIAGALALAWAATGAVHAEGNPQHGAIVYRACAACHSLEPGLHLTGPSLASDGQEYSFWALNLRLKVDSNSLGPKVENLC